MTQSDTLMTPQTCSLSATITLEKLYQVETLPVPNFKIRTLSQRIMVKFMQYIFMYL